MATRITKCVQSDIFTKCARHLLAVGAQNGLCSRCIVFRNNVTSRYSGEKRSMDKPLKRKVLRKIKAKICSQNMLNPDMEKEARFRKLQVPLDDVKKGWTTKHYPHQVQTMASYLGVFDHMFSGRSFRPMVVMNIDFQDGEAVHYGNFIEPTKASCEPKVLFTPNDYSLTTLLMVNLDGNVFSREEEILHWMIGNIPNGEISQGEVVSSYLPPCPIRETGYHRFVFCLLNQETRCDFDETHTTQNSRSLASRSFKTARFLDSFQLDPVGLGFFQARWDKSVSSTFTEILGVKEPVYDLEKFLTPNQKKRLQVKEVFANKYKNM